MTCWVVDRRIHFGPEDLVKNGFTHFGFHDRNGKHYAISHQKHFLGLIGRTGRLERTSAATKDVLKLNLPEISSMDYHDSHLFVPKDITPEEGGLAVLTRTRR